MVALKLTVRMYSIGDLPMHFLVTPRRRLGVALTTKEVRDFKPIKGDVQINETPHTVLGRLTTEAFILNTGRGPDALPPLLDALAAVAFAIGYLRPGSMRG